MFRWIDGACGRRKRQAAFHPVFEDRDLRIFELSTWRHRLDAFFLPNGVKEKTFLRLSRRHEWTLRLATLFDRFGRIEPQSAVLFCGAMAAKAPLHEKRPNFGFKELRVLGNEKRLTSRSPTDRPRHRNKHEKGWRYRPK
jgi:hypothetical protein